MILPALRLSLLVSLQATLLVALAGTGAGWLLARRQFRGREVLDALFNLPLVLPPTVTGYYLLLLIGRRGPIGGPLLRLTGLSLTFTLAACVLAASVMAFPLMARSARVAFEELDRRHEIAAATLGHGPASAFFRVAVPLARRGLAAGVVLSFARALGEFGATLMVAGNIPGRTQTLPLAVYEAVFSGQDARAAVLALLLTAVSVAAMLAVGSLGRWKP
ncbi:MAG: molybdate ABC transporter permease subunit [Acidobacteria bacterium]|nr:MAG: molybdate ABC transporter permease subunit [Acidobacteriota bacterium]